MNKEEFINQLKKDNIDINDRIMEKLNIYKDFLIEYNEHTNLTAIKNEEGIYLKHFYDSIILSKYYKFDNERILDIGTGAGFPGMVLKIFFPNLKITLLDSNNKKIKFLQELNKKLNIDDVETICDRAEEYCKKARESFDIVTSRAVSNLTTLSEISLPFVKKEGYFIPLKGGNEEEITSAQYAISVLGGEIEKEYNYTLPIEESKRTILLIKKIKNTPNLYPRQYSKIVKNPLKKEEK